MPAENINGPSCAELASSKGGQIDEIMFEGYGPGGAARSGDGYRQS
jgi:hypothetical protein